VAGQRVVVLDLVVVQRRVFAHPPIHVEGVVEELFGERVKHNFGLGHGLLLRGGLRAGKRYERRFNCNANSFCFRIH
jgi:hypothetical protein